MHSARGWVEVCRRLRIVEHYLAPTMLFELRKRSAESLPRQIDHHAKHYDKGRNCRVKSGLEQFLQKVVGFEIDGHESQLRRNADIGTAKDAPFPILSGGMIDLEDHDFLSQAAAIGERVQSSTKDDHLMHPAVRNAACETILRKARAGRNEKADALAMLLIILKQRSIALMAFNDFEWREHL